MSVEQTPDLDDAITRALRRAKDAGRGASVFDLFSALLDTPDVRALVGDVGGDPQELASDLQCAADARPAMDPLMRWWYAPPAAFRQPIVIAAGRKRGRGPIGPAEVFAAGFDADDRELRAALERAGLSRASVLRRLCGGPQADALDAVPEGDSLEVVLLNDD